MLLISCKSWKSTFWEYPYFDTKVDCKFPSSSNSWVIVSVAALLFRSLKNLIRLLIPSTTLALSLMISWASSVVTFSYLIEWVVLVVALTILWWTAICSLSSFSKYDSQRGWCLTCPSPNPRSRACQAHALPCLASALWYLAAGCVYWALCR